MRYTRRDLLKHSSTLAAVGAIPTGAIQRPLMALLGAHPEPVPPIEDPRLKQLTSASLDAARAAGASYADARLTHDYLFRIGGLAGDHEFMSFGVRVLVDGYWGFASSPVWSVDEAGRLGRAAVRQAKANVLGKSRSVDMAPAASVQDGHWQTPIKDDPFLMSRDEIKDFMTALLMFISKQRATLADAPGMEFFKQDKAFASTSGQYFTQRIYRTSAGFPFTVVGATRRVVTGLYLTPATLGFEYMRDQPLRDYIRQLVEEAYEDGSLPVKPVDVGRYTVLLDASTVAGAISQTIGVATELDRAMGFEANAGGTSYITDPTEMVGTLKVGGSALTVTANRSEPAGAATVKWDDEGVEPRDVTLVDKGILTTMQADREGTGWLKDVLAKQGKPLQSNGCSHAPNAALPPLTHTANLKLQSPESAMTLDSMIKDIPKGIMVRRGQTQMDFQQVTGLLLGAMYEIKDGKRIASLATSGIIFRTPELWNGVLAIGGTGSASRFGLQADKGQPMQTAFHSVTASPVTFKELTVVDPTRKA